MSEGRALKVRLGRLVENGVAPSIWGLLELGAERRPEILGRMRGRMVFRFDEDFSPLRIAFRPRSVIIEDGDLRKPDAVISGSLPDIVHFLTVPMLGGRLEGIPDFRDAKGRAAIARVAAGRVRIEGDRVLARRLLVLLAPQSDSAKSRARSTRRRTP